MPHLLEQMKTATPHELRNRYTHLLEWIKAGEEIRITRRGVEIARLAALGSDNVPIEE